MLTMLALNKFDVLKTIYPCLVTAIKAAAAKALQIKQMAMRQAQCTIKWAIAHRL